MKTKAKMSPKKKIVIAVGAVVVVLTAALLFVSNYLVNYAIGRSGDGGDREVALEVEASPDSVPRQSSRRTAHSTARTSTPSQLPIREKM